MSRFFKNAAFPILIVVVLAFFAQRLISPGEEKPKPNFSQFQAQVSNGDVKEVTLKTRDNTIDVTKIDGKTKYQTGYPNNYEPRLIDELGKNNVQIKVKGKGGSSWLSILTYILPFLLFFGFWIFLMNQVQGGGSRVMSFGKSRAKRLSVDSPMVTFRDVAGVDEAVEELQEIKEFLENPKKFQALGARIPKGVLLYGPPGTGKTLLARAVAGEAGVPFFSISGSDFVEMFVGVGASRVRDLFEQAKNNAPAIIFIDEIDAVGRHRGAGMGGGHDEREQTLNQMLVEMDGFDVRGGVILIAATNRPDMLDPALLRPGRFDRQISVEAPDLQGRFQILKVHAEGKPMGTDVDLEGVARRTPGFTGADLANVLNEAALLTARQNARQITDEYLDEAIDRVVAGPQKRSRLMNDKEKLVTAYHEGGHALVAAALPGTDPVQKVTILPRGRALGYTMVLPEQDKYANTRAELLDQLAYMMGGRAAEELVFHDPTTGASNDIEKATTLARAMVTQYGMTERLGAIKLGSGDAEPFLGRDIGHGRDYSEEVAAIVDEEVSRLISNAHQEAFDILNENRDVLDDLVRALFEKETLDRGEVAAVFQPLRLWPKRPPWTGSDERVPSAIPPVTPPPPSINGQTGANGQAGAGQAPSSSHEITAGGAPQPPGHSPVPSQWPTAGESDPQPQRGPDFR